MREPQWARSVWSQTNSIYWHSMGGGLWCILCNALGRAKHDVLKGPWFFFLMQPDSAQETKRERADDAGCQRFYIIQTRKRKKIKWRFVVESACCLHCYAGHEKSSSGATIFSRLALFAALGFLCGIWRHCRTHRREPHVPPGCNYYPLCI